MCSVILMPYKLFQQKVQAGLLVPMKTIFLQPQAKWFSCNNLPQGGRSDQTLPEVLFF